TPSPADGFAIYAHLGQAWALEERGFSNGAEAEFEAARKAAQVARDGAAEAEALIALSFVAGRVSGLPAGLALLDRALRLSAGAPLDPHPDRRAGRAGLRGLQGGPEAVADAEAGLASARRAGALRPEAQALRSAEKGHFCPSRYPPAVAFYRQAEERF